MRGFRFAKLILAYAAYSETEDGRECLFWDLNGEEEMRVILENGTGVSSESRRRVNGEFTEWSGSSERECVHLEDAVNDSFRLLDSLGIDPCEVVGSGFDADEDLDESIPKRRFRRG